MRIPTTPLNKNIPLFINKNDFPIDKAFVLIWKWNIFQGSYRASTHSLHGNGSIGLHSIDYMAPFYLFPKGSLKVDPTH